MGNMIGGASNVTSGVKAQAAGSGKGQAMYELVSTTGGGILVDLLKEVSKSKDYAKLETKIKETVKPFLYNGGEGQIVHVSEFVLGRCADKGVVLNKPESEGTPTRPPTEELDVGSPSKFFTYDAVIGIWS